MESYIPRVSPVNRVEGPVVGKVLNIWEKSLYLQSESKPKGEKEVKKEDSFW